MFPHAVRGLEAASAILSELRAQPVASCTQLPASVVTLGTPMADGSIGPQGCEHPVGTDKAADRPARACASTWSPGERVTGSEGDSVAAAVVAAHRLVRAAGAVQGRCAPGARVVVGRFRLLRAAGLGFWVVLAAPVRIVGLMLRRASGR